MRFVDLGIVAYDEAYQLQCQTVEAIASGGGEIVHLLEHPHVFTLGRRGSEANLLVADGPGLTPVEVHRVNRGGDITYHGPGQLVGYPHLDLRVRGRDLGRFLRSLEAVLIRTVAEFGVHGFRREGLTGVWTVSGKVASIGIGVRHWITMHGFALNVSPDLRYFARINPCGIEGCPVTSLAILAGKDVAMVTVKQALQDAFLEVFPPAGTAFRSPGGILPVSG